MTDEMIIKVLECCKAGDCDNCPFYGRKEDCEVELPEEALNLINRQKAEIERYRKEHKEFCIRLGNLHSLELKVMDRADEIKSEAIKEFAERLKEKAGRGFWNELAFVDVDDIDNLVEEMVGESTTEESSDSRKSKWEIDCDGYYPYCPKCGEEPPSGKMTNFCPNCGNDMRGDK
jgi:hypothetical protein